MGIEVGGRQNGDRQQIVVITVVVITVIVITVIVITVIVIFAFEFDDVGEAAGLDVDLNGYGLALAEFKRRGKKPSPQPRRDFAGVRFAVKLGNQTQSFHHLEPWK